MIDPPAFVHDFQNFEAVHFRHDNIKKHQCDLTVMLLYSCHSLYSVPSFQYLVVIFEHVRKNRTVQLRIVYNQYFPFFASFICVHAGFLIIPLILSSHFTI